MQPARGAMAREWRRAAGRGAAAAPLRAPSGPPREPAAGPAGGGWQSSGFPVALSVVGSLVSERYKLSARAVSYLRSGRVRS